MGLRIYPQISHIDPRWPLLAAESTSDRHSWTMDQLKMVTCLLNHMDKQVCVHSVILISLIEKLIVSFTKGCEQCHLAVNMGLKWKPNSVVRYSAAEKFHNWDEIKIWGFALSTQLFEVSLNIATSGFFNKKGLLLLLFLRNHGPVALCHHHVAENLTICYFNYY